LRQAFQGMYKETKRFSIVIEDLLRFKDWVIENN